MLLVSTDPASNLDDEFGIQVGSSATPVAEVPGLALMNLDPEAAASAYRERRVGPYRGILRGVLLGMLGGLILFVYGYLPTL